MRYEEAKKNSRRRFFWVCFALRVGRTRLSLPNSDVSSVNFLSYISRILPFELASGAPALSADISGAGPSDGGLVGADVFSTEVAGGHGGRRRNGVSRTTMAGNLYVYVEYS